MARTRGTALEGLTLGLIGFGAVAVFYTVLDVLAGQGWFFTLNLLGQVLFRGVRDAAVLQLPMPLDVGAMAGYNFLHLFVSLAVGFFVAWLVDLVEENPRHGHAALAIMVAGYVGTVVAVALFARDVAPLLPLWSVITVNTLAAGAGGLYLWRGHPGLLARLLGAGPAQQA